MTAARVGGGEAEMRGVMDGAGGWPATCGFQVRRFDQMSGHYGRGSTATQPHVWSAPLCLRRGPRRVAHRTANSRGRGHSGCAHEDGGDQRTTERAPAEDSGQTAGPACEGGQRAGCWAGRLSAGCCALWLVAGDRGPRPVLALRHHTGRILAPHAAGGQFRGHG